MKLLPPAELHGYQLEVIECDCGYHMGVDATFINQVGDFVTNCPSCSRKIDTAEVIPL